MIPPIPRLSDYDISPEYGFLPAEIPLTVLPDRYYSPWEAIIQNLQGLILSKRLRPLVDKLPVLDTDALLTEVEWRRAYSVLAFIAHAYIWGGDTPADVRQPVPGSSSDWTETNRRNADRSPARINTVQNRVRAP
jgi:indoleamine 2,3-dioxygenase